MAPGKAPCPPGQPPPGPRADGEPPHHRLKEEAPDPIADAPAVAGEGTGVAAGQPGAGTGRELQRDLGARVAGPDDEHRTVAQLAGVAIGAGVQLPDGRIDPLGERGHPGGGIRPGGDHDVAGLQAPRAGCDPVPGAVPRRLLHLHPEPNGEREAGRVGLQLIGHLVLGRCVLPARRERHPRQAVEAARWEQPQGGPPFAPAVAEAVLGVQDHKATTRPGQVVAGRQARRPAASPAVSILSGFISTFLSG